MSRCDVVRRTVRLLAQITRQVASLLRGEDSVIPADLPVAVAVGASS